MPSNAELMDLHPREASTHQAKASPLTCSRGREQEPLPSERTLNRYLLSFALLTWHLPYISSTEYHPIGESPSSSSYNFFLNWQSSSVCYPYASPPYSDAASLRSTSTSYMQLCGYSCVATAVCRADGR